MEKVLSAPVMLAVILCFVLGCGESTPAPPQAASPPPATELPPPPPDPVAEFKEIVSRFAADRETINTSYDVTKTDSLVTPLQGTFRYTYPVGSVHFSVTYGNGTTNNDYYFQAVFAYQESKWVLARVCLTWLERSTFCEGIETATSDGYHGWDSVLAGEHTAWAALKQHGEHP